MLIDFKQLKNLPVKTESGILLGYVNDFTLETETLSLKQINVNTNKLLVFSDDLLISSEQIVSITTEKIVVQESVKKIPVAENPAQKISPEPATALNVETQN
ncbi:MAG: hypothetical protein UT32_C0035G0005 [Parcubacteria group bacterium GW2011_GWC2_39_14]|nr:MAG: hypothetical protein UT32_C0035G0005 [Parcubacteria group bacterium GW2011_GWC2_39_14]KKR53681.1 MAG: hypothetical protein UT91_C0024G0004 [Parcubacteria group bacterium GW2011_GWA2_40_23]